MSVAPPWPFPRVLAHRGGGALAPENTIAAIRAGLDRGFRAVEFDAMLAADNVPVLMHDPTLERTGLVGGVVSAFRIPAARGFSTTAATATCTSARASRSADMRYGEQVFEITVPLDDVDWTASDPMPQIVERFHRRHEVLYTYAMPDQESVLVNARVTVSGILEELPREPSLSPSPPAAPRTERRLYLNGWVMAPVYRFDTLAPEQRIGGPAVIESAMTTVLLRPGDAATVTAQGWLDIAVPASG